MGRKKKPYGLTGRTEDGKMVMTGAYFFTATYGFPLVDLLFELSDANAVVDWIDYYESALELGMKSDRILKRIESATCEAYSESYSKEVMDRFELYLKQGEENGK